MKFIVNGEEHTFESGMTVQDLLDSLDYPTQNGGLAVAVNDEVVAQQQWPSCKLSENDRVEIIHATQGG
ncbi:MAG: sulfur carrier protein ThiS [Balneolaceae bacterium]